MLAVGVGWGLDALLAFYVWYGLEVSPGSLPRPDIALALSEPMWVPMIGLMGTYLILLFPHGQLPSPRWRPWAWLCAVAIVLPFVGILIAPGSYADSGYPNVENPLGIEALGPVIGPLFIVIALIPISILGCAVALIQRFLRSHGQDRLQLKWLAAGAGTAAILYLFVMVPSLAYQSAWGNSQPTWLGILQGVAIYSFVLIPIAIGIAILRHRLYDIDLIINRTLVYGALTAGLTAAYLLTVTILQGVFRPFAERSDLTVAGSTLLVAALFRPGRARVQAFIDRRFYRRKYDAGQTLERFSARLRDEIDLEALSKELVSLVGDVMQPMHVSLWLRETRGRVESGG
jgi:hypothetical protein